MIFQIIMNTTHSEEISPGWYYYHNQPLWQWFLLEFFLLVCVFTFCLLLFAFFFFFFIRFYHNKDKEGERLPDQFTYKEQGEKQQLSEIHSISATCSLASLANKDDNDTDVDSEKVAMYERPLSGTLQELSNILEEDSENVDENYEKDTNNDIEQDTENKFNTTRPVSGINTEILEEIDKEEV